MTVISMERPQKVCRRCNRVVFCECENERSMKTTFITELDVKEMAVLETLSEYASKHCGRGFGVEFSVSDSLVLRHLLMKLRAAETGVKRL